MLSQNKKRIAYLSALTLLFSYAELFIPRFLPFFRFGLGNVAVLLSFSLDPLSFILLTVIKSVASCLMAGTFFSPFFLLSFDKVCQILANKFNAYLSDLVGL